MTRGPFSRNCIEKRTGLTRRGNMSAKCWNRLPLRQTDLLVLLLACSRELGGTVLTPSVPVDWSLSAGQGRSRTRCELVALRRARSDQSGGFLAGRLARHILKRSDGPGGLPVFRRPTGNCLHVVLCFVGQFALPREPILNSARPGIVGGSREPEIALRCSTSRPRRERSRSSRPDETMSRSSPPFSATTSVRPASTITVGSHPVVQFCLRV